MKVTAMHDHFGATMLDPSPLGNRRSLSDEVFHILPDAISAGRFAPGSPLRDVAVAQHFGVSATPVRDALRRLEREGLVTSQAHRGTVVAQVTIVTMANLYELHETLEAYAVRRAAEIGPHNLTLIKRLLQQMDNSLFLTDHKTFNRLDLRFHRSLNELAGNQQIAELIEQTHRRIQAARLRLDIGLPDRPQHSQTQHRAILEAVERSDSVEAERLARLHISSVREPVLVAMKGGRGP